MIDLCVQTFLNENNYFEERNDLCIVSYIIVGAAVSDFGLPWDLLADIDFLV